MNGRRLSQRQVWRRAGRLGLIGLVALVILFLTGRHYSSFRNHYLDASDTLGRIGITATDRFLPSNDWRGSCRQHGFSAYHRPRKVFDLVMFSTELDWLEVRLHTHSPYVDYFVIIESPTTFTNKPKPLVLKENWDRYTDFHHKMIYKVVEDPIVSARHWDHEDYLRNALLRDVFPGLTGSQAARKNDVLVVSDMDELIKPGALLLMRHCDFPKRLTLRSHFYYYSFQWRHKGEQWPHPQATTFGKSVDSTLAPNDLRQNLMGPGLAPLASLSRWWNSATLWNAGWHCSSCFSTIKEMQTKMGSFSHSGWNTKDNREARIMVDRVRNGLDLFARPDQIYDKTEDNKDVPEYVMDAFKRNGRFKYLLNRDGDDAGFEDWATL